MKVNLRRSMECYVKFDNSIGLLMKINFVEVITKN